MQKHTALINLALAFIFIFGAAFSCGQNNDNRRSSTELYPNEPGDRLTKAIVEREVRARFESPVENGHEAWGVRIQRIDLEDPRPWEYGNGGGGHAGQMMFPARVQFTQRKYYTDRTEVREIDSVFHCVMNSGRWNCERGPELANRQEKLPDEPPAGNP